MKDTLSECIVKKKSSYTPIWFMRQAGRILPSYRELKKSHHFYSMMKDKDLATKVTLLPIEDLKVDAAILFSDILVTSASSFSYSAALLNNGEIYYKPFWHPPMNNWIIC